MSMEGCNTSSISGITLRYRLPQQVEKHSHQDISKYVVAKYVYFTKNNNALKHRYKTVDFPDDNVLYVSRRDEINGMLCPIKSGFSLPKWNCVFRRCMS